VFLQGLRERCDRHGILLVFDEIQCGFGRTGRMWACDHAGVVPDLMTVGKGIGGGLPVSAVLGRESAMGAWSPDAVSSTFLTNALGFAAGIAAIDVLVEEHLVARAAALGDRALERLHAGLADVPHVGDIRGRGLLIGIELVESRETLEPARDRTRLVIRRMRERGVIVGHSGRNMNVVKLSPPLVTEDADWDRVIDDLVEVIATATEGSAS
jgi:4-aminobutyrate aminotransferase-like enzyme